MLPDHWRAAARFGIGVLAFSVAACQSAQQNMASANGAASVNSAAGNGSAETNAVAAPSAAENAQRQADAAALAVAENATGPVALASDAELPQTCQAYVRAIQACIGRVRASGQFVEHRERMLRGRLHADRTDVWPAWARAEFLERGCTAQTEGIGTVYPEC